MNYWPTHFCSPWCRCQQTNYWYQPPVYYYFPTASVCPVCDGKQTVPKGFYEDKQQLETDTAREKCRSCNGTGVLR